MVLAEIEGLALHAEHPRIRHLANAMLAARGLPPVTEKSAVEAEEACLEIASASEPGKMLLRVDWLVVTTKTALEIAKLVADDCRASG